MSEFGIFLHAYRYVVSGATATGVFLAAARRNLGFIFERGPGSQRVELRIRPPFNSRLAFPSNSNGNADWIGFFHGRSRLAAVAERQIAEQRICIWAAQV